MSKIEKESVYLHNAKLKDGRIYHGSYFHHFLDNKECWIKVIVDILTVDGETDHRFNHPEIFLDLSHRFNSETGLPLEAVNSAVAFLRYEQWQRREKFRKIIHRAEDCFSEEELTKIKVWAHGSTAKTLETAMRLREFGVESDQTIYFIRKLSFYQLVDLGHLIKNYGEGKTAGKIRHIADKARNFTYLRNCFPEIKRWSGNLPEVLKTLSVFADILDMKESELASNTLGDYCPQLKKLQSVA